MAIKVIFGRVIEGVNRAFGIKEKEARQEEGESQDVGSLDICAGRFVLHTVKGVS